MFNLNCCVNQQFEKTIGFIENVRLCEAIETRIILNTWLITDQKLYKHLMFKSMDINKKVCFSFEISYSLISNQFLSVGKNCKKINNLLLNEILNI